MDGFRSSALLCGLVALGSASCDGLSHACTELGCVGGVIATLQPQVAWQGGDYSLKLELDSQSFACQFAPASDSALPTCDGTCLSPGPETTISCGDGVTVTIQPGASCADVGNGPGPDCVPIPPMFDIFFRVAATPVSMSVELSRDGAVVLEDSRALVYQDSYPNGEDCPPACRQAQLVLELNE